MKYYLLFVIVLFYFPTYSQKDSLKLFTKYSCSNCKYTKQQLLDNTVNYIEYNLESRDNASEMLKLLSQIKYKGKIFLPVIFLNNRVLYPICNIDSSFVEVSLQNVIDSIISKSESGQIKTFLESEITESNKYDINSENIDDCQISYVYLICSNLEIKEEAILFVEKLNDNGYNNAGFIYHQNYYRVYCDYFIDEQIANKELMKLRNKNKIAYLLFINN